MTIGNRKRIDFTLRRIGFFWFVPDGKGGCRFLSKSAPMDSIPTVGGFKTHPVGHVDHWPELVRADASLLGYGYEYFPRGRVNWREDDGTFVLLADAAILEGGLDKVVVSKWNLGGSNVERARDPHYRVNRLAVDR